MIVPAPLQRLSGGQLRLDTKFVSGMQAHLAHWPGPITVVIEEGGAVPFGGTYDPNTLGFDLLILPAGTDDIFTAVQPLLQDAVGIYASADMHNVFGHWPVPVVYTVEYTLETRLQILRLDPGRGWVAKLWSALWNLRVERRRLRALRGATGLQCNGYPAMAAYQGANDRSLLYFDGRMRPDMFATTAEMQAKAQWSGPLRLVHSGRLEPMKGGQDLLAVLRILQAAGVDFRCDIFGTGSLEPVLRAAMAEFGGRVIMHQPVDFETVLMPWMRRSADVFLSCHRQSDPSCSYIEALGCGVPVAGYANNMWSRMALESGGGWVVPLGAQVALAQLVQRLAKDRTQITQAANHGLSFSQAHDFEGEFIARMLHLRECFALARTPQ